ncbi:MAG: UDP-N-acetylglucosamine 2-epimerase (hydrolyzing) [Nitrospirae bacterium]|nr:UDP-N-acetylglucosamine 2-epimerase (hydrolyzing) [Nitrospirota bacterium]
MNKKRHICFFTGKRGGFSHMVPIIEKINNNENLSYSIVASDMHLSDGFGKTVTEVEKWTERCYKIDTMLSSDSRVGRAKSIGIGIIGFSQLLDSICPDLVFILGDRGEVLGMAIAALEMNIPIVHLFGGDVTQGGVDEPVRHAITKLASIHLTSNQDSADRILKMGEESWRVFNVGSPVLDLILQKQFTNPYKISKKFNIDLKKPIILLLQHSVTWQVEKAESQIRCSMEALDELGYQTVAIYPCSDPGYEDIIKVLREYEGKPYFQLYKNVDFRDFWGLLNVSSVLLGNSSAGVMETASFKIPFINVGIRQEGRLRANNVIDVEHDKKQIVEAIKTALFDESFIANVKTCISPYGDGQAAKRIVSIFEELEINETLIKKRMTY